MNNLSLENLYYKYIEIKKEADTVLSDKHNDNKYISYFKVKFDIENPYISLMDMINANFLNIHIC